MTIKIKTPANGKPIYIIHLTKDDDVVGSIKLNNKQDVDDFKDSIKCLYEKKWGIVMLEFDTND